MSNSIPSVSRRHFFAWAGVVFGARLWPTIAAERQDVAPQPYFAAVNRAIATLERLGSPVAPEDSEQLARLARQNDHIAMDAAEKILAKYTLAYIVTEPDGYARATVGGAQKTLLEQGWRLFLIRVANPVSTCDKLNASIWQRYPLVTPSTGASRPGINDTLNMAPYVAKNWLALQLYEAAPMSPALSGFEIEYRVIQLYSRDRGLQTAEINFYTALDQYAAYFASKKHRGISVNFECFPSRDVGLRIRDSDGRGCMASLTIKDRLGRVYPLQAMRLAPDMQFHPQIYRGDGESVRLPDGEYVVESKRGPEYLPGIQTVVVDAAKAQIAIQLQRWIDPAKWGWYSGDTHIHAAGCLHYERPTEGVSPATVIRHVRGEALSIADVLSWGPAWYYQKQFFTGHAESPQATLEHPELQAASNATWQPRPTAEDKESQLRYDVEVSGFPSSHCGHLVLLRLREQDYPGTKIIQDWPSWNLPILQWARAQGAIAGYAHCGNGMVVESTELPNYEVPPMDGNGTQEAIVDVTHGVVDFLSGCNTVPIAELNAWYHMMNCGFRMGMLGETDYPCFSGERPGVGRSYVRLDQRPTGDAGYEAWVRSLQKGRHYCGDGRSHFLDFRVNDRRSGDDELALKHSGTVRIEALVAARLGPEPTPNLGSTTDPFNANRFWHIEKARIGSTREVAVEVVVNGIAVEKTRLLADGEPRVVKFETTLRRSSWIALRIFPSSHTHPVFVKVGGRAIRASKRSAEWCRACVDRIWEVKSPFIRESERSTAAQAFEHARKTYETIIAESEVA